MQGKYITLEEFKHYQQHEMDSALGVLDMNLRNDNLRNQVAARLLGFSSYEALQPMFNHEWNLFYTIVYEQSCPYQGGRPVLRHRNLLVVIDFQKCQIYGRALCTGEEREYVGHWNANWSINFPRDIVFNQQPKNLQLIPEAGDNYRTKLTFKGDSGFMMKLNAFVNAQGVSVHCTMDNGGLHLDSDGEVLGYRTLGFDDCLEKDAMNNVNQAALKFEDGEPCSEKEVYRWLLKTNDGGNSPRLLSLGGLDWREDKLAPTDLIFFSIAEAQRFPHDNDMDYEPEDFDGLVLCRVTHHQV